MVYTYWPALSFRYSPHTHPAAGLSLSPIAFFALIPLLGFH